MRNFVDIEIETTNPTGAVNRLHSLGLEKGNGIHLFTLDLESVDNLFYFTFRVWEDRVHVIPKKNNPTFKIVWRSDEHDEDGNLLPHPMVEAPTPNTDGNPQTRMQGVGRIA